MITVGLRPEDYFLIVAEDHIISKQARQTIEVVKPIKAYIVVDRLIDTSLSMNTDTTISLDTLSMAAPGHGPMSSKGGSTILVSRDAAKRGEMPRDTVGPLDTDHGSEKI